MKTILLNENWTMTFGGEALPCSVPCSVYETLTAAGRIPDPYWGENEWISTPISDQDATFETHFNIPEDMRKAERLYLRLEGVDTLAEIWLNGVLLGKTDNMHRIWEFPLPDGLRREECALRVNILSPSRFVREKYEKRPLWGVESTMPGYPYLRKAHCMFGWDWGPVLPDMGLWRSVSLHACSGGRIRDVYYSQRHEDGSVVLTCSAALELFSGQAQAVLTVTAPDGKVFTAPLEGGRAEIRIDDPMLWWVRGLGAQPLYRCRLDLLVNGVSVDVHERRIGLRTLSVSREKDQWGEEFCFINNGVRVFAMGANYIPEDQLLPRITPERTRRLLEDCKCANYNLIRVWGGGFYPDESFYDWCDENGMIVWQDFMFACSAYLLEDDFERTVRAEIRDNVIRLRNHPSLGLWCGNNEIESAWEGWGLPEDPQAKADYLRLFEDMIPGILRELDPETFYWPSSPSSGGGFRDASSNRAGDMHYWAVWHNFKPIEAFRKLYYRFCSEYGFESIPDLKTIRAFTDEKNPDLCGNVMEAHQKCTQGNEKIMYYLAQMVNYPCDFERLIYCSQLVQADCIRSNVEHMRRARGRCMGSVYWQVNDSNPVISWSSIDYFGRWKGLHYAARRFYAPLLLSCDDTDPLHPALWVTNDTRTGETLRISCRLRNSRAEVLREWESAAEVPALSAVSCLTLDLSDDLNTRERKRSTYLEYTLEKNGEIISRGTTLFVRPKAFEFMRPLIDFTVREEADSLALTLSTDCFAKSVCLSLDGADCVFSDNWFDLHGREPVIVRLPKTVRRAEDQEPLILTPEDLTARLRIRSY